MQIVGVNGTERKFKTFERRNPGRKEVFRCLGRDNHFGFPSNSILANEIKKGGLQRENTQYEKLAPIFLDSKLNSRAVFLDPFSSTSSTTININKTVDWDLKTKASNLLY